MSITSSKTAKEAIVKILHRNRVEEMQAKGYHDPKKHDPELPRCSKCHDDCVPLEKLSHEEKEKYYKISNAILETLVSVSENEEYF